jgi:Cu/Ag efflux protein CusF
MKSAIRSLLLAAAIGAAAIAPATVAGQTPTPPSRSREMLISVVARVEAINLTTREVTLKESTGRIDTFTVDTRVTRLNEVKVGDQVFAEYYVSFVAELRAPTAEEKANPLQVLQTTQRAPAGTSPAAGVLRMTKAVVTVEGLDRPTRSITVSGKNGLMTVEVEDVAALSKLHLGDTIVVTYTEALAVSIEKRPGK